MEILTAINEEASRQFSGRQYCHRCYVWMNWLNKSNSCIAKNELMAFIILYSEKNDPVKSYLLKEKVPFVVIGAAGRYMKDKVTYIDNDNKALGTGSSDLFIMLMVIKK